MSHYLGVDGGGSHCTAVILDGAGRDIARGRGGPANVLSVSQERVERSLREAIGGALTKAQLAVEDLAATCVGLAGGGRPSTRRIGRQLLDRIGSFAQLTITHDAEIALVGGIGRRHGVALIAGTGAMAYGVNAQGRMGRADGWGHLLGDEGSGYWIGREGLRAALRAYDGRGPSTRLAERLKARLDAADVDAVVDCIYGAKGDVMQVASLAPVVLACAQEGDPAAQEIVQDAGQRLARTAGTVIERLGMGAARFEVVLCGGLFAHGTILWPIVATAVVEIASRATVIAPRHDAAYGAALWARSRNAAGREDHDE